MSQGQIRAGKSSKGTSLSALVAAQLSAHVGPGRDWDIDEAACWAKVHSKTMRRYVDGTTTPDAEALLNLMKVLPDTFAAAILRGIGFAGAFRVAGGYSAPETLRETLEGAAQLAQALVDGRVDHTEWPAVKREMDQAQAAIARFLAEQSRKFDGVSP